MFLTEVVSKLIPQTKDWHGACNYRTRKLNLRVHCLVLSIAFLEFSQYFLFFLHMVYGRDACLIPYGNTLHLFPKCRQCKLICTCHFLK